MALASVCHNFGKSWVARKVVFVLVFTGGIDSAVDVFSETWEGGFVGRGNEYNKCFETNS